MTPTKLSAKLSIGSEPTADDLAALAEAGFRSVINNRTDKEGKFQGEVEAGTWHHGPAAMLTKIHMATHNWMHQYMYECPIDDRNIRVFLVNMRNCVLESTADKQVEDRCKVIAGQDIEIVEALQPTKTPPTAIREVVVAADSVIVGYRRWLQKWKPTPGGRCGSATWRNAWRRRIWWVRICVLT